MGEQADQLALGGVPDAPTAGGAKTTATGRARKAARARVKPGPEPAAELPVARVCVDLPLPHLDRPFDYLVPADLDAVVGSRVRVRFSGQLVDGFVLERVAGSDHTGKLAFLAKLVSPEPVLAPEIAVAARQLANRYAGTLADVLRLAIPPRHARAEASAPGRPSNDIEAVQGEGESSPADDGPGSEVGEATAPEDAVSPAEVETVSIEDRAASAEDRPARSEAGSAPITGEPEPTDGVPTSAASRESFVDGSESADNRAGLADAGIAPTVAGTEPENDAPTVRASIEGELASAEGVSARGEAVSIDGAAVPAEARRVSVTSEIVPSGDRPSLREDEAADSTATSSAEGMTSGWGRYVSGQSYLGAIADGRSPRAVWTAVPGEDWPGRIAEAAAACVRRDQGVVVVVPDARDLDRLDEAMTRVLGPDHHVTLSASLGPEARYKRWLAVRRGAVRVAVGTRATSFAPVENLGLVVIWDDGDDLHDEPRAPYPHAREVLLTRAQLAGAAVLVGAHGRSAEAQQLLATGWAAEIVADRNTVRAAMPRVTPVGDDADVARDEAAAVARLPTQAWRIARESLAAGAPVLIQVPRRGYLPSVACQRCRTPARCTECSGPLALASGQAVPACRWCGRLAGAWSCGNCGSPRLRASIVGARRTAEELGRAFPDTPVRTSGRDGILASVPNEPCLVISTPGAEPICAGPGYGAALLLDSWALLTRADLRAGEEALRRWANAVALVRPASLGGRVMVHAEGSIDVVQALLRWDSAWHAQRELVGRNELGFPPAVRMASITGKAAAVTELIDLAALPDGTEPLGPVPVRSPRAGDQPEVELERMLLRTTRGQGMALAAALHAAAGVRSARKAPDPVRIEVDPVEMW